MNGQKPKLHIDSRITFLKSIFEKIIIIPMDFFAQSGQCESYLLGQKITEREIRFKPASRFWNMLTLIYWLGIIIENKKVM